MILFFNSCFNFGEGSGPLSSICSTVFCVNEYQSSEKKDLNKNVAPAELAGAAKKPHT